MCLAVPGRVIDVRNDAGLRMATVDFGGVRREACLECTPEATVGDNVLVHVGFALSVVDEQEARRTLRDLRGLGIDERGDAMRTSGTTRTAHGPADV